MRALGAEVVLVDQLAGSVSGQVSGGDTEMVEQETQRVLRERESCLPGRPIRACGQLSSTLLAHRSGDPAPAEGKIDAFCDFVGTGGTFAGCAIAFKEHDPNIQTYVVEPKGSAILAGQSITYPNRRIQDGGYSMGELKMLRPD